MTHLSEGRWIVTNCTRWLIGVLLVSVICLGSAAMAEELKAGEAPKEPTTGAAQSEMAGVYKTIGVGATAALVISLTVLGAAYAVARIGSAAMGAAAEKPELLIRSILFVALAEGLAVLGFVIAMMLVQKM